MLAAVGIFSKNQLWIKNLFDFYLTKWYNYAISYQGEVLGKRNPQQPLFYSFNMADMIPKNHILRLINKYVDFSFIGNKEARRAIQGVANLSNYAINGLGLLYIFQKQSCLPQASLRIIFCSC